MKPPSKIKDWTLFYLHQEPHLAGHIFDHHTLGDSGPGSISTQIVAIHKSINKVETRNTMYTLIGKGDCQLKADDVVIR